MFAVLIPVGPSNREVARLDDAVDALRAAERPDDIELILIDDAPEPRDLTGRFGWPSACVIRTPLWAGGRPPDPASAMVAGTLAGLRLAARLDVEFLLKLDTDALAIGAFADALRDALADPAVGIVGSYDRTCTGGVRDWTRWRRPLARVGLPVSLVAAPDTRVGLRLVHRPRAARQAARRLLRQARAQGYVTGEHCLGGAYAVSRALLARDDLFVPAPWLGTGLAEDVVVGLLCRAAGLRLRGLVGRDEPFGVHHVGLPAMPAELLASGHSIVHAVKHHDPATEERLRAVFRVARAT
jgi:hypothetical protein